MVRFLDTNTTLELFVKFLPNPTNLIRRQRDLIGKVIQVQELNLTNKKSDDLIRKKMHDIEQLLLLLPYEGVSLKFKRLREKKVCKLLNLIK